MNRLKNTLLGMGILFLISCEKKVPTSDAYGNFEAREVIVSAEANGKLLSFEVEEGKTLKTNELVGLVDTTQLYLKKKQLQASIGTIASKTQDIGSQINVLREKRSNLVREQKRVKALLAENAATTKQLDDIEGNIDFIDKQIVATSTQIASRNQGILSERSPLEVRIEQINDQLKKSYIRNPMSGTVLTKMTEPSELVAYGKPLYKIADLSTMILRVYVSGEQLAKLKIGQNAQVVVDAGKGKTQALSGKISWIASQAEFTPKTIQTREERVNMVYAVKIQVKNNGKLKIGMPAEVNFK